MDILEIKTKIKEILVISKPFIQKLVDEKVIPAIKTFAYKTLQKRSDKAITSLVKLKEKAENETDETKKFAHLTGLKLGASALISIGEKLIESGNILLEE